MLTQAPPSQIFHITQRGTWELSLAKGDYDLPSRATEGFLHCSTKEQVPKVALAHFRGQTGLVLLTIDVTKLHHAVVFENLNGGSELYPHIYGPLNHEAVVAVADFTAPKA